MNSVFFNSTAGIGLLAIALVSGCSSGGDFASVTGSVTFDGKPVQRGTISFESTNAGGSAGGPRRIMTYIREGKYSFESTDGPAPGEHKVYISAFKSVGGSTAPAGKDGKQAATRDSGKVESEDYIPAKYNRQTSLKADIAAGLNENVDFVLSP